MRQTLLFLGLTAMVLIPFAIWGEAWTTRFSLEGSIQWLRDYGQWAWLAGIVMLVSDLILPIPGTLVMAGLGYIYGPIIGGIIAAIGSYLSGTIGYWLCRSLGPNITMQILGQKDFEKGTRTFNRVGGWLVVLSRWLPVFPEVIACMAGLNRMSIAKFHLALLCSAVPMGIVYASVGHAGVENPTIAIILSAGLPPIIWLALRPLFDSKTREL